MRNAFLTVVALVPVLTGCVVETVAKTAVDVRSLSPQLDHCLMQA